VRISAISAGERDSGRNSRFCRPTPCSAEIEPPIGSSGL